MNDQNQRAEAGNAEAERAVMEGCKVLFRKYQAAMSEIRVRLEILDDDLEFRFKRNPIHHIESRMKSPASTIEKMYRYGVPITIESLEENVYDVAGIRVICSYTDDVYRILKMVEAQDDLEIVKVKDYIANPKPNGYRSLHAVVRVPVFFMDKKEYVPVEIQFRTIAMDFWASLEHSLKYKQTAKFPGIDMTDELKNCSDIIEDVEQRMQILMHAIETVEADEQRVVELGHQLDEHKKLHGEI